jgi:hypothetical protein
MKIPHRSAAFRPAAVLLALAACAGWDARAAPPAPSPTLHYAPNHNFGARGQYLPAAAGFNMADVSSVAQLDSLTGATKGLAWIGLCRGVNAQFLRAVTPYAGHRNLFGFYLMDDPDPARRCPPEHLRAEADWVHTHFPGAVTFVVLMNLGRARSPSYLGSYNPENSHVDLYGVSPYPCRSWGGCDFSLIETYVAAAEASGVPRNAIVPVFQSFGGGNWKDETGSRYVMPTAAEAEEMLARWRKLLPRPVFDMAYSWGSQRGDTALENADPDLRAAFERHNRR